MKFNSVIKNILTLISFILFFYSGTLLVFQLKNTITHTTLRYLLDTKTKLTTWQVHLISQDNISILACQHSTCKSWQKITFKNKSELMFTSIPQYYNPYKTVTIVYVHGQNELITNKAYLNKLDKWSNLLNNNSYILFAPNLFGNNWGSDIALKELIQLTKYIKLQYPYTKIYLLAYSMGGLLAYKIISIPEYLKIYDKVIIFAGTIPLSIINKNFCQTLHDNQNKIKIYHGTEDINVPFNASTGYLINYCKTFNISILPIVKTIPNYDHWQLGYTTDIQLLLGKK